MKERSKIRESWRRARILGHLRKRDVAVASAAATQSGTLEFHTHGSERFLKVIRSGDGSGVYFPETGAERKVQARANAAAAAAMQ
jgi:hypothetical protein